MSKKSVVIFGAGYAGLMAAYHLSKTRKVTILEKKKEISCNHSALFRFNEDISNIIPIPLQKVTVRKNIYYKDALYNQSNIKLNNLYSYKTTGKYTERSIMDISDGVRFIPSADYFEKLKGLCESNGVKFITDAEVLKENFMDEHTHKISTLPLPMALRILGINPEVSFEAQPIKTITTNVPDLLLNLHQTIYFPEEIHEENFYRISIIGNRVVGEYKEDLNYMPRAIGDFKSNLYNAFGIDPDIFMNATHPVTSKQRLGKLIKIDEKKRKELVYKITKQTGTYSLGRFATWRQIMTPEVVKDILRIEQWLDLDGLSDYDKQKAVKL